MSSHNRKTIEKDLGHNKFQTLQHGPEEKRNARCFDLLHQLQQSDVTQLRLYATWRLRRASLEAITGEDIVQDALSAVLRGLESLESGRHPSEDDLATQATFCNYLRGAINSIVEAKSRHFRRPTCIISLEDVVNATIEIPIHSSPAEEIQIKNLREELFRRLERKAPKQLRSTLSAWAKQSAWADKIPLGTGCRRHRAELRRLAAQIMSELYS
jgi:DNA-directed RNA polymerase specialized sigma24 family protein